MKIVELINQFEKDMVRGRKSTDQIELRFSKWVELEESCRRHLEFWFDTVLDSTWSDTALILDPDRLSSDCTVAIRTSCMYVFHCTSGIRTVLPGTLLHGIVM